MTFYKLYFCVILFINVVLINSFSGINDEVKNLPGLDYPLNFKHYSGYLNSTDGRFLHYWFVESQSSPTEDPLILWMNGGPGCSSVLGLLTEQGPFRVNADGQTLYPNFNAWNLAANVIFLEAPAGVGFSYKEDKKYATNDDEVAKANYVALQSFFNKFPHFQTNPFYVMGESYAGIYVPTLSVNVLRGETNINFKGFAIGNGYLDRNLLGNSLIYFGYYHGLYGRNLWNQLVDNCCTNNVVIEKCNFVSNTNSSCIEAVQKASSLMHSPGIDEYNLYAPCVENDNNKFNKTSKFSRQYFDRKLMLKSLKLDNKNLIEKLSSSPPCVDTSNIDKWINQKSVRKSLHIPDTVDDWTECSDSLNYTTLYDTMKPQILELMSSPKNLKGLVYNGDVDMACNFLGDQWFVEDLGLKIVQDYVPWEYNKQTTGFFKMYERFAFVTVKGSGHMVPTDKAGPALLMIQTFLNYPTN